jgi:hypothetical protein
MPNLTAHEKCSGTAVLGCENWKEEDRTEISRTSG